MALIHVLDEVTINKIAAGEVVERPASVIKELLENSLDAGATSIEVEIANGGTTYMRVTDNGSGMTEEDARLAVLRHATSKIRSVDDLFDIASLGFRGEALASIASVSHFSLTTRKVDQELGTRILIDGGKFTDCLPFGAQPGTTIEVRDLFFNTPARRKFLKTERTEGAKIQDIVGKLALSNPHVAFKLINNDTVSIVVPGNGNLIDTVSALYGYKVSDDIFPIAYESEGITIQGVVSKPTLLKSSRIWQTVVVNNRVIADKAITKAIDNAYHALLPKGGYPLVLLTITVPPGTVDINVHPRKSEVKFEDDKPVFKAVYHAILQALQNPMQQVAGRDNSGIAGLDGFGDDSITTAVNYDKAFTDHDLAKINDIDIRPDSGSTINLDFDTVGFNDSVSNSGVRNATAYSMPEVTQQAREKTNEFVNRIRREGYEAPTKTTYEQSSWIESGDFNDAVVPKSYTEEDKERFRQLASSLRGNVGSGINSNTGIAGEGVNAGSDSSLSESESVSATGESARNTFSVNTTGLLPLGQVAACYILAKKGDNLYIIDQHAAHERIRYDKLCKSAEAIPMQELLIPQYIEANEEELIIAEEQNNTLLNLGFQVVQGGPTQLKIEGLPIDLVESKGEEILRYVFSMLKDYQTPTKAQLRHEMLAYASCRGAIKAGHTLNTYQMSVLIEDLFHTDKPYVCPHGRPTIIKFTPEELGKLFLRS